MKPLLVLASFFAAASAGISGFGIGGGISGSSSGYSGNPGGYSGGGGGGFSSVNGFPGSGIGGFGGGTPTLGGYAGVDGSGSGFGGSGGGGGQIRKFISVHVGPDDPQITQTKVIRAGGIPDKHVNIIFIRSPTNSNQQNTEVVLPEPPQQKTLVYVLLRKNPDSSNNVRVRGPAPTKPSKPEVYFIRYKDSVAPGAPGAGNGFPGDGSVGVGGNVGPGPAYGPPGSSGGGVNVNSGY